MLGRYKKNKFRTIFISLSIIYLVVSLSTYIKFGSRDIVIENFKDNDISQEERFVYVNYVSIDDIKINNKEFAHNYKKTGKYGIRIAKDEKVIIKVPIFSNARISFKRTKDSSYVKIKDINRDRVINLFGDKENVICNPTVTSFIYYFVYWIIVSLLFLLIYKLIDYCIKKEKLVKVFRCDILWILVVAISTRILFLKYFRNFYILFYDTESYEFYFESVRLPVYPLLIKLANILTFSQASKYICVVLFQIIIGLISIYVFWKIVNDITSRKISVLLTLMFSSLPFIIYYEHAILSESLSILLLLLCIRRVQLYLKKCSKKNMALIVLFITLAIFERPAFIYLIPLIIGFLLVYGILNKASHAFVHCLFMLIPILLILIYCVLCYFNVGFFDFTTVPTLYNKGYNVTTNNYYDGTEFKLIENDVTSDKLKYNNKHFAYLFKEFNKYGSDYIAFINDSIAVNRKEHYYHILNKFVDNFEKMAIYSPISGYDKLEFDNHQYDISEYRIYSEKILNYLLFPFTYGFLIVFSLVSVIMATYRFVVDKKLNWMMMGLSLIILLTIFITFMNSIDDYQRLTITVIPCMYLLIAAWTREFKFRNSKSE
ncbi:MAG: glycosyltransferase family 39 protein [Bacilli bacterium]|nr:glycosyltransferase family 39 protein [Bacilli bacterium]